MSGPETPFDPNISRLKRTAKTLKKAVEANDPGAIDRVAARDVEISFPFGLRNAQLVIAREHGFAGWHELIEEAGERMVDERDIHRWFGVELNNAGWSLIDGDGDVTAWPAHEVEEALYRTYAAAYHWMQVGTPIHHGRAEHLISRTAAVLGRSDLALHHARRYRQIIADHPDQAEDWDVAFSLEAFARALAACGRKEEAAEAKAKAELACAAVVEAEDRSIVEAELSRGPWFGL